MIARFVRPGMGMRGAFLAGALACVFPAGVAAQRDPPWSVRFEAGVAELHEGEGRSFLAGAAVAGTPGAGYVRLELGGAWGGPSPVGFGTIAGAAELRILPDRSWTPVLAGRYGLILEPGYLGVFGDLGLGVVIRPRNGPTARVAITRGGHPEASGPHTLVVGIELPLGRGGG